MKNWGKAVPGTKNSKGQGHGGELDFKEGQCGAE